MLQALDKILVLDYGSQYSQLIARRLREHGVYCELHPEGLSASKIRTFNPCGIILSGGPEAVTDEHYSTLPENLFDFGVPILGICYGMHLLAVSLGGTAEKSPVHEYGATTLSINPENPLMQEVGEGGELEVWMSHGISVSKLPPGAVSLATSKTCPIAGFYHPKSSSYALQFHPEVTHTRGGSAILKHFATIICGCKPSWQGAFVKNQIITTLRKQIGKRKVALGLSGGVDSAVAATLLHQAVGDQLTCFFVDNGLLRLHEAEEVMDTFSTQRRIRVVHLDAREQFLQALNNISDPEEKRKIIGREFIEVFSEAMQQAGGVELLAQGTIYSDVIESAGGSGKAKVIKSHHNVGGLPPELSLELVEPLRKLFKDEVRALGSEMGLPSALINRHPFPGPGLAVRVLGEIKASYLEILKQADHIFIEELHTTGMYDKVAQAFAVFVPVRSVGVVGDNRRYGYTIALRAVESNDFMTANWARLPAEALARVANRIVAEIPEVTRVVYDITNKPPATIEWE